MKKKSLFISCLLIIGGLNAQKTLPTSGPGVIDGPTVVSTAKSFKITQSLNMLLSQNQIDKIDFEGIKEMHDRDYRKAQTFKYTVADGSEYGNDSASIQRTMGTRLPLAVIKQWPGQNGNADPLDPSGAVGLTQYVQAVNATPFAVYSKTGTGTATYTGSVGTVTGSGTDGDPVVLYDKFADRWFLAQLDGWSGFALAVSATNNPAGAWYSYQFTATQMPDYLKFSVWDDGYYMTSNNGSGIVYCFERDAMLTGSPSARSITKTFTEPTGAGFGFWLPLPGDADGVIPPAGQRCPLFSYTDNAWGTGEIDGVKIWSMGVTWGTTPAATITLDATLPTAAFDASYNSSWDDITQPGSQKLDGLGGVCMFRAQWNSFIGTNRVVLNWGVKLSATQRSIKWVELRQDQTSGVWSLYQEGIYAPDAANRWNGSAAMDCNGDIALCYAKASSTIPVSLAYTGRVPSDPLGTMSLAETVVVTGTGSKSGSNRFGDYSQTSIDPSDDNTFWHTGMYINGGNSRTYIYSFQIAPCTVGIDEDAAAVTSVTAVQNGNNIEIKASNLKNNDENVVQLYDISGKKISESKINPVLKSFETSINASGLKSGIYLVRIGTPDYQKVVKVAIQ
jgi:hypothetical protein